MAELRRHRRPWEGVDLLAVDAADRAQLVEAMERRRTAELRASPARFRAAARRLDQALTVLADRRLQLLADHRADEPETTDAEAVVADERATERPPPDQPPQLVGNLTFAPGAPGVLLVAQL